MAAGTRAPRAERVIGMRVMSRTLRSSARAARVEGLRCGSRPARVPPRARAPARLRPRRACATLLLPPSHLWGDGPARGSAAVRRVRREGRCIVVMTGGMSGSGWASASGPRGWVRWPGPCDRLACGFRVARVTIRFSSPTTVRSRHSCPAGTASHRRSGP